MKRSRLFFGALIATLAGPVAGQQTAAVTPGGLAAPPPPAAPRAVAVPAPSVTTLSNGLRVIAVPRPGSGLVTVEALVRAGGARDSKNKGGVASMTADLLTQGAGGRTAPQIAEAVEALGTSINANAGWDGSSAEMTVIRGRLAQAMPLLADVVIRPAFAPAEVQRLKTQTLDDLAVSLQEPGTLVRFAATKALFGDAPYGHPLGGTPETVRAIGRADVAAFHRANYRPDNAVLLIVGDITARDAFDLAARNFGGWKRPAAPLLEPPALPAPTGKRRVLVIDKPDADQAAVYVIRPGIRREDPAYYRGIVANAVLGTGFSSRLNREVRIKRGLSYGAGSGLDARRGVGPFVAVSQTKNPSAGEVAQVIVGELGRLATAPLPQAELATRQAVLTGGFSRSLETTAGLAGRVSELALYGLPLAELNRYLPTVRAVTPAQARQFARERLSPSAATVLVVGDAKQFLPDLKKRLPGYPVEVIPVSRLDLNRASLRKG